MLGRGLRSCWERLAFAVLVPRERLKLFEGHFAILVGVDCVEDLLMNGHHLQDS